MSFSRGGRVFSRLCPQCGGPVKCSVRQISESIYFYDEYTLQCENENCGYIAKQKIEKGATYLGARDYLGGARETECPFCGEKAKYHPRTPKEPLANPAKP
jgi:C4-type Zn-finger protein